MKKMKDKIRKILKEETNRSGDAFYLLLDKRTNKVMDPGLWRMGFEDSGGSAYGTWEIDFENPKAIAQYSFKNLDEIEEVKEDIEIEWNRLDRMNNKGWNIVEEMEYLEKLYENLEVKAFTLAVIPYDTDFEI